MFLQLGCMTMSPGTAVMIQLEKCFKCIQLSSEFCAADFLVSQTGSLSCSRYVVQLQQNICHQSDSEHE